MKLEYCIECGHPLEDETVCPGCQCEIRQLIPIGEAAYEKLPDQVISDFESGKVSLLNRSARKAAINYFRQGKGGYLHVKISQMYVNPAEQRSWDRMYVSMKDMNGNPFELDVPIKKRGPEHLKLQKDYSKSLKNTEALLVRFSENTYYVFSLSSEPELGKLFCQYWSEIQVYGGYNTSRKVHFPRYNLDKPDKKSIYDPIDAGALDMHLAETREGRAVEEAVVKGIDTIVGAIVSHLDENE